MDSGVWGGGGGWGSTFLTDSQATLVLLGRDHTVRPSGLIRPLSCFPSPKPSLSLIRSHPFVTLSPLPARLYYTQSPCDQGIMSILQMGRLRPAEELVQVTQGICRAQLLSPLWGMVGASQNLSDGYWSRGFLLLNSVNFDPAHEPNLFSMSFLSSVA